MPFTEKRLAGPTQLTTGATALYTVPANRTTIVKQIVATNTSASAATFTLYIGTAVAANAVFNATSVAANDSLVINLSQVLSTGEVLRALASANTAINLTISGVENDGPLTPTATYIANNAITTAKLADSSVTQTKLGSTLSGVTIVTSSTRSSLIPTPFDGQVCYETDTDKTLVWNGSAWVFISTSTANPIGLELITSCTASSTGGTAATASGGVVTIGTSNTSVTVSNAFSSSYDNYVIYYTNGSGDTAGSQIQMQLGSVTTNYRYLGNVAGFSESAFTYTTSGLTGTFWHVGYGGLNSDAFSRIEVGSPFLTKEKTVIATGGRRNNMVNIMGVLVDSTSCSSFKFTPSSGTLTGGNIRVYGYRNS